MSRSMSTYIIVGSDGEDFHDELDKAEGLDSLDAYCDKKIDDERIEVFYIYDDYPFDGLDELSNLMIGIKLEDGGETMELSDEFVSSLPKKIEEAKKIFKEKTGKEGKAFMLCRIR